MSSFYPREVGACIHIHNPVRCQGCIKWVRVDKNANYGICHLMVEPVHELTFVPARKGGKTMRTHENDTCSWAKAAEVIDV